MKIYLRDWFWFAAVAGLALVLWARERTITTLNAENHRSQHDITLLDNSFTEQTEYIQRLHDQMDELARDREAYRREIITIRNDKVALQGVKEQVKKLRQENFMLSMDLEIVQQAYDHLEVLLPLVQVESGRLKNDEVKP